MMYFWKYIAECSVRSEQFTTLTKSVNQGKVCQLFSVVLVKLKHQREPEKTSSVFMFAELCFSPMIYTHTYTHTLSHDYTHTLSGSTPQIPQAHILVMVRASQYPISNRVHLCIAKEGFVTWKSLKFPKCWQAKRHRLWWGWWFSEGGNHLGKKHFFRFWYYNHQDALFWSTDSVLWHSNTSYIHELSVSSFKFLN